MRKIWIVPVSAAGLALLFFLVYTCVILSVRGQRRYTETSTFYIDFAQNENTQTVYDYFNAATWESFLYTVPEIFRTIQAELPEGMTLEEAKEFTSADLVSDIRVLTVTVTAPSAEDTAQLSLALQDALVQFGETAKEFDRIRFLSSTEPELVVVSDRSANALLLGAVLGLLFSAFGLWLHEVLDDRVYTPEEAHDRYGLPVLGVLAAERARGARPLPAFLQEEMPENLRAAAQKGTLHLITSEADVPLTETAASLEASSGAPITADPPQAGQQAVLVLPCGRGSGTRTEHDLEQAELAGVHLCGIILTGADGLFLSRYYRCGRARDARP